MSSKPQPEVDLVKFFAGGVIAAVIAGLAGVVYRGVANALLDEDLAIDPPGEGGYELLSVGSTLVVSVGAGIAATIVLFLFIQAVPRPLTMFNTLGVVFLAASMLPILTLVDPPVSTLDQAVLAGLHLVVGFTILGLLSGVARSTVSVRRPPPGYPPQNLPPQQPSQQGYQQPGQGYPPQQPGGGYGGQQ